MLKFQNVKTLTTVNVKKKKNTKENSEEAFNRG